MMGEYLEEYEGFKSLSNYVLVDNKTKSQYLKLIINKLSLKKDYYSSSPITSIVYKYFYVESNY